MIMIEIESIVIVALTHALNVVIRDMGLGLLHRLKLTPAHSLTAFVRPVARVFATQMHPFHRCWSPEGVQRVTQSSARV